MMLGYLRKHITWSKKTFGKGAKTESICRHIEKELQEIREEPQKLEEWVDVIILAFDGAWRAGYNEYEILHELARKQSVNFSRKWQQPDNPDDPIEHVRN